MNNRTVLRKSFSPDRRKEEIHPEDNHKSGHAAEGIDDDQGRITDGLMSGYTQESKEQPAEK